MKKILVILMITTLSVLCFTACSQKDDGEDQNEQGELEYEDEFNIGAAGLDEIMEITFPEGFINEDGDVKDDADRLVATWYSNGTLSAYAMLLACDGKAVMGSNTTIEDWQKEQGNIADQVKIEKATSDAYIYPVGLEPSESEDGDNSVIEAVFAYNDYIVMVGLSNDQGEDLSKEQRAMFYDMLKSIKLKDLK